MLSRARAGRARVPARARGLRRRGGHRRAVLRHGARRRATSSRARCRPRSTRPRTRRRIGEELVDALVEVHAVDWRALGLEGFGKPTGYLERQLRRFLGLWEHNRTRDIPAVERVGAWLARAPARVRPGDDRPRRLPPGQHDVRARRAGAARRDLRLGDGDDRRPAGRRRLPRARCGSSATTRRAGMFELGRVTRAAGLPHARGARRALRGALGALDDRHPLVPTLALWKSIVFMEGNYKRALAGATDDPYLKALRRRRHRARAARRRRSARRG